jgi:SPP1 family predicted phage head-tail adaptor
MSLESLCNRHSATIERPTITSGASMGQTRSYATTYTISCTIQPISGRQVVEFGKRGLTVTHRAYTTTPLAILAGDRLVIDGVYYLIKEWENEADRDRLYSLLVERKQ